SPVGTSGTTYSRLADDSCSRTRSTDLQPPISARRKIGARIAGYGDRPSRPDRPPPPAKWPVDYRSVVDRQGLSPPFPRALPLVLRIRLGRIDQRRGQIHLRLEQCTLIERRLQVIGLCRQADEQSEFPDRLGLIWSHLPVVAHPICSPIYCSISASIDRINSMIASFGSAVPALAGRIARQWRPLVARTLPDEGRLCVDLSSHPHEQSRSPAFSPPSCRPPESPCATSQYIRRRIYRTRQVSLRRAPRPNQRAVS